MDDRTFGAYEASVMTLGSNVANGLDNLMRGQLSRFEGAIDPQGRFPGQLIPFRPGRLISRATTATTTTPPTPTTAGPSREGLPCRLGFATNTTACSTTPIHRSTRTSTLVPVRVFRRRSDPARCCVLRIVRLAGSGSPTRITSRRASDLRGMFRATDA